MQILKGNNFRLILYAANLLQISNDKCENFQNYLIFKTCQTALLKTFIIKYFNKTENFHISNLKQRRKMKEQDWVLMKENKHNYFCILEIKAIM